MNKFELSKFDGVLRRHVLRVVSYIGRVDSIPDLEDEIKTALDDGAAYLFSKCDDSGTFFILQPIVISQIPAVNILFAYSPNGNAIKKYLPVIEELSKDIGAEIVTGYTRHKKILELCEFCGFVTKGITKQGLYEFHKPIE